MNIATVGGVVNIATVVIAPDQYRVQITENIGQASLLTVTRARDYARLLRADGWAMLAEDIEGAAEPPDTCASGDGNFAEWGSFCGPCAQGADDAAEQDRRTRTAGA